MRRPILTWRRFWERCVLAFAATVFAWITIEGITVLLYRGDYSRLLTLLPAYVLSAWLAAGVALSLFGITSVIAFPNMIIEKVRKNRRQS